MSGGSTSRSEWHAHFWAPAWVRPTLLCGGRASVLTPRIGLTLIDTCSPCAWQHSLLRKVNNKWQQWLTTHTLKWHTQISMRHYFLRKGGVASGKSQLWPRPVQSCRFCINNMVEKGLWGAWAVQEPEGVKLARKTEPGHKYVLIQFFEKNAGLLQFYWSCKVIL